MILENLEHCGGEPELADTGIALYAVPLAWQAKLHAVQFSQDIDADRPMLTNCSHFSGLHTFLD